MVQEKKGRTKKKGKGGYEMLVWRVQAVERKVGGRGIVVDGVQRSDDGVRAEELDNGGARRIVE